MTPTQHDHAADSLPPGRPLTRESAGRPAAPVRIVHLGVGNFTRAHEAWYTEHAPDAADWGIAAFTGRSAGVADELSPQEGLYHLLVRDPGGDRVELVGSLSEVHPARDLDAWRRLLADPAVVVVSSTITEAGYLVGADGHLRTGDATLAAELQALHEDAGAPVTTAPARFVAGLLARRAAQAGAVTFLPCDNVPGNGEMVRRVLTEAAGVVDPTLQQWIHDHVTVVTTMVDRITPRATDADRDEVVEQAGFHDASPVVTEPFSEWVLSGRFAGGRPRWEDAGARFVDDIGPFEDRKLRLLNGAHTLMACIGPLLGCRTVGEAIANERLSQWVTDWWDAARSTIDLPAAELDTYTSALRERFANPRIHHQLAQIAEDGSAKVPIRVVPVLRAERAAGRDGAAASRIIAGWILHLRGRGAPVKDAHADEWVPLVEGDLGRAAAAVLQHLGLAGDEALVSQVTEQAEELDKLTGSAR